MWGKIQQESEVCRILWCDRLLGSLKLNNPFSWILRFHSSKKHKMFLLKSQVISNIALGLKSDSIVDLGHTWNLKVLTLYRHDALGQYQRIIQKNYHQNLPGAFVVCPQTPSNSEKRFGLVVDKFFELRHIFKSWIAGTEIWTCQISGMTMAVSTLEHRNRNF